MSRFPLSRRLADLGPARLARRAVAVVAVLVVAWFGWLLTRVLLDLGAATDAASTLQAALTEGDESRSREALDTLEQKSRAARDRTDGASWGLLTHLPFVGDDARGLQVASSVLADLTGGIAPAVDAAAGLQDLAPVDGAVPLDRVEALQAPVARAGEAFAVAQERLDAEDASGYTGRLQVRYRDLRTKIVNAREGVATASTAVQLLPPMLGSEGPRRYLLVFQNNAEIRSTGGLAGSVALVEARKGKITLVTQESGASFGEQPEPVLPLTEGERQVFGPQLGTYFLDATFTPDFPRVAELVAAHWRQRFDQEVDGVFAVDPVTLSYVLGATGGVNVGTAENPQVFTAENTVQTLLNTVYLNIQDPVAQDAFFELVAEKIFERFTQGGGESSSAGLLAAVAQGISEHRVLGHSFHEDEQAALAGRTIVGELPGDPEDPDPQVGVYLNDNTGSKMSFYLRADVEVRARSCEDSVQEITAEASLTSTTAPDADTTLPASVTGGGAYGIEPGSQLVAVRIYGPVGGTVTDLVLDGEPVEGVETVDVDGRPVASVFALLEPARTVDVTWTMQSGPGQTGDVDLAVTPGIAPGSTSSVQPGAC